MAAASFASFLSSPTIRLILPTTTEDKTYTIHRSLLASQTALLKSQRTRSAYILLDQSTVSVPTVEQALEYLYTGDYALPAQDAAQEEEEDTATLLETSRPAAHLPQNSPLLAAAMAGSIGIWGKAAPRFDVAENTSTYTSIYFPAEDKRKKVQLVTSGEGFDDKKEAAHALLPSPPASPVFQAYEPVLSLKGAAKKLEEQKTPVEVVPYDVACLRAHIAVWRFAEAPGVGIPGLAKLALDKLAVLFEGAAGEKLTRLVEEMVGAVFGGEKEETVLRTFVVGKVVCRIAELSRRKEFNEFIRRGGEFVVDVLGSLADARDGC
ncbi:uncharacterized protein H6S33_008587 [Morchella sextelata]|uniref:uncharacterized protein n=1 Tax=Morchella sextelata TaxID=1174677 RepID=UPI001D056E64|nr:uncharacterized protein H6S33_009880 [Morchella sextelata]XP_044687701.1 uncharacterized protein H6S33_008587 [Morchella sextelata]KAH0602239.1 hypothetical protein H6S33_009880 [Morchella sextelata]KAH0602506.1 hypothetical protein H6S33_008587 [Morchella sextelata]